MSVRVTLNEETGLYELGDDVEGVFIAFVTLPKTAVESRVAALLEAEKTSGAATQAKPATADTSGDYVDNGDGTYTRQSDGAIGRFGPSGFTADTQS